MKQIAGRDGFPAVFGLARGEGGLWVGNRWADPGSHWNPGDEFVFSLRPSTSLRAGKENETSNPQKLGLLDRILRR